MRRLIIGAIALVLSGCTLFPTPSPPPPVLLVSVDTPDGTIGVFKNERGVHLWLVNQDTGAQKVTPTPTVHLFTLGGETGRTYNSFVFGAAPPGAARVELAGLQAIGGEVKGGVYILALRDKSILPTQLNWKFVTEFGAVVVQGSNITD
ncbi:MAG: hypothetical protein HYX55_02265 [Chloroflexi bacterium]|nr:hypothetical protein [Chloroflexota bacterium]